MMGGVSAPVAPCEASAVPAPVTELYLIRHGNARKLQGETYVTAPLTELGIEQARRTGEYLQAQEMRFDGYFTSPLKRAVETAGWIGKAIGQEALVQLGMQEMEYREIPAMLACELLARTGVLNRYFESRAGKQIYYPTVGRIATAVLNILGQHAHGRVGVIVHGGVISSILSWYFPRERQRWWREPVGNCSITHLKVESTGATLISFDEIAHLGALAPTAHQRNYTFSTGRGV